MVWRKRRQKPARTLHAPSAVDNTDDDDAGDAVAADDGDGGGDDDGQDGDENCRQVAVATVAAKDYDVAVAVVAESERG